MYRFIESIKVEDQRVFLLEMHQKRVNDTFANFGKPELAIDLKKIFTDLHVDENGLFKWRIVYDLDGNFRTQLIPYAISHINDFQLVENNNFDYSFKFEDRRELDRMKTKSRTGEIILVKNNHITDTSFSNLLFLKNKVWYTPSTYLLNGIQRQHLLKTNTVKELEITLNTIKEFSHFQIINSMNYFGETFVYPIEKIINLPGYDDTEIE